MKWQFWKTARPGMVGIEMAASHVSLCWRTGNASQVEGCEVIAWDGEIWPQDQLNALVEEQNLAGMACSVILPVGSYQLMLVEAPQVEAEEMREAVRFRIKDMLSFPWQEALVDVFNTPEDSNRSGRKMVYAVALQESKVKEIMPRIADAGLRLESVDIAELSLRNVFEQEGRDERGVAVVRMLAGRGALCLLRQGQLYLSRQFDLNYHGGLFDELPEDQLLLEIQRSLDYYERQMGQVQPSSVYLCGENLTEDKLTENLRASLSSSLSIVDMTEWSCCAAGFKPDLSQVYASITAMGGALRQPAAGV